MIARRSPVRGWATTALALVIVGFLLFPVYWMVNASLQTNTSILQVPPIWFPVHPVFTGYQRALTTESGSLGTSLIVAAGTVLFTLVLTTPCAYALSQVRWRGVGWIIFALLIAQMIPSIVLAESLYGIFNRVGLLNTYPGLILADSTAAVPFAILILRSFMFSIPRDLTEVARVDGAGYWRTLWYVIVPVSRNALLTAGLFSFLFAWSDFLFALAIFSSPDLTPPITLGMYHFVGAQGLVQWPVVMATAVMACVPAGVLLVVAQRSVSAGLTGGAVKE
jgi:multiple sugar transport system permease protein